MAIKAPLQERETAAAEADSTAKLRLMRQDAAAKGAQLETLLSANQGRLETMLGCRGRGETCCEDLLHLHKWPQDNSQLSMISLDSSLVARLPLHY